MVRHGSIELSSVAPLDVASKRRRSANSFSSNCSPRPPSSASSPLAPLSTRGGRQMQWGGRFQTLPELPKGEPAAQAKTDTEPSLMHLDNKPPMSARISRINSAWDDASTRASTSTRANAVALLPQLGSGATSRQLHPSMSWKSSPLFGADEDWEDVDDTERLLIHLDNKPPMSACIARINSAWDDASTYGSISTCANTVAPLSQLGSGATSRQLSTSTSRTSSPSLGSDEDWSDDDSDFSSLQSERVKSHQDSARATAFVGFARATAFLFYESRSRTK